MQTSLMETVPPIDCWKGEQRNGVVTRREWEEGLALSVMVAVWSSWKMTAMLMILGVMQEREGKRVIR